MAGVRSIRSRRVPVVLIALAVGGQAPVSSGLAQPRHLAASATPSARRAAPDSDSVTNIAQQGST